ncbi:MAG: DUF6062 family protein [Candidatus Bathyarchaeia archaeon]
MVEKNISTIPILEGIKRSEGCPLCYLWLKNEERLMEYLLKNEVAMDAQFRKKILAAKGFCNRHMHLLYKTFNRGHTENGLGYATYMKEVIERIIEQFSSLSPGILNSLKDSANSNIFVSRRKRKSTFSLFSDTLEKVVHGEVPCPACEYLWSSDERYLHTLIQMLDKKDFQQEFKTSKGLCLSHFMSAIKCVSRNTPKNPSAIAQTLVEVEMKRLKLTVDCLQEYIKKHRWEFKNDVFGEEAAANQMVLSLIAGVEGLSFRVHLKK